MIAFGIIIFRYHSHAFAVIILILYKFYFFRGSVTHHKPAMFNVFTKIVASAEAAFADIVFMPKLVTLFDILVYFYILTFLCFIFQNAFLIANEKC